MFCRYRQTHEHQVVWPTRLQSVIVVIFFLRWIIQRAIITWNCSLFRFKHILLETMRVFSHAEQCEINCFILVFANFGKWRSSADQFLNTLCFKRWRHTWSYFLPLWPACSPWLLQVVVKVQFPFKGYYTCDWLWMLPYRLWTFLLWSFNFWP